MVWNKCFLGVLLIAFNISAVSDSVITYNVHGRLGDSLTSYCKARWFAYKYGIPTFYYASFEYADKLKLSVAHKQYNKKKFPHSTQITVHDESNTNFRKKNTLYIIDAYCKMRDLIDIESDEFFCAQYDDVFIKQLKDLISPIEPIDILKVPSDMLTVAVHVRRGGGYDLPLFAEQSPDVLPVEKKLLAKKYVDVGFPTKFPPLQFYIDQILRIAQLFPEQQIYVFLFTDDPNPKELADTFAKTVNNSNIIFDYRKSGTAHNAYVLEDFFSMIQFDCLIRPNSAFSKVGQLIGDYKLVICPKQYRWKDKQLIIDSVHMYTRENPWWKQ